MFPRIRLNMRWRNKRPSANFQGPSGLRLRSLVVFDRPSHPHVASVEVSHRPAASLVSIDDYWRSQIPVYNQNILMNSPESTYSALAAVPIVIGAPISTRGLPQYRSKHGDIR